MMMISDDDRREVARRLRELRGGWSSGECYYTIIHALDLPDTSREDGGHELYGTLADLIEPSEPKVRCVAEVKVDGEQLEEIERKVAAKCVPVDRDALLALADEMQSQAYLQLLWTLGYVDVRYLIYYARRIREALGVTGDAQLG